MIDTTDADPDQQDGDQEAERGRQGVGGLQRGSTIRESVYLFRRLIKVFRGKKHRSGNKCEK